MLMAFTLDFPNRFSALEGVFDQSEKLICDLTILKLLIPLGVVVFKRYPLS